MKNVFTLLFLLTISAAFAQRYHAIAGPPITLNDPLLRSKPDTLPWSDGLSLIAYRAYADEDFNLFGYICGTDLLGTLQNAQMFSNSNKIRVLGALYWFADRSYGSGDTNSAIIFKAYKLDQPFVNNASEIVPGPGTVIAQKTVKIANLPFGGSFATGAKAQFFDHPATIDSDYAIGYDMSHINILDTVGLVSSLNGKPGRTEKSVEQHAGGGNWYSFLDSSEANGYWALDIDLFIWPIVDYTLFDTVTTAICKDSTYNFNGTLLTHSGVYTDTLTAVSTGKDSVITLYLTVRADSTHLIDTICGGSSINFQGNDYNASGTYTAHLTNHISCDSTVLLHLVVADALNTTVSIHGDTITSNQANADYQWIDCTFGFSLINQNDQSFIGEYGKTYQVELQRYNCTDTSTCIELVGIDELSKLSFSLQPNPAKDICTIYSGDVKGGSWTASIYNVQGQLVKNLFREQSLHLYSFNTGSLNPGIYLVRVNDAQGNTGIRKLVIQ